MSSESPRHGFALEDLETIRQNLDGAKLTTFEYEFIMGILENGRIDENICKLSKKEFPILRGIAIKLRRQQKHKGENAVCAHPIRK